MILTLVFAVAALFVLRPGPEEGARRALLTIGLLSLAFGGSLVCAYLLVRWVWLVQYAQAFYDLSLKDAQDQVDRLLLGVRMQPPKFPTLRVQEGRADPDGPSLLYKVGGPGHLSVAHDNAVVTHRLGRIYRVLGPGFYDLEPFERVWDVIDLRPQRRKIRVDFMTRDGIPAYCEAEMRFRVAKPAEAVVSHFADRPIQNLPYDFSKKAVLDLATSKFMRGREGSGRVSDWRYGITGGTLDGEIRNLLERYKLDELLNPRADDTVVGDDGREPPPTLETLEVTIAQEVHKVAEERGIVVEDLKLKPPMPTEEAISRQWLEYWQAKLQHDVAKYKTIPGEAARAEIIEETRTRAEAELVSRIFQEVQTLNYDGVELRSELIVMSFIGVLRSMADRDPVMQRLMFQQSENLLRIINAVRKGNPPFGVEIPAQQQADIEREIKKLEDQQRREDAEMGISSNFET
jgi:hypothetical protein